MLANRMPRRLYGFSLIEMAVTLTIIGVVITLALPAFGEWLRNLQIRTAGEAIQNGLQIARAESVRRNAAVEFVLGAGSSWTVRLANVGTVVQSRSSGEGSSNVVLAVQPAGAAIVTFDGLGRRVALNADGSAALTRIDVDLPASILPAEKTRDLRIEVGIGGQIRMCDPNVTDATDSRKC